MQSSPRIDELKQKFHENPRRYFAPLANEYRKAGDAEQAIAICRAHLAQQPGHMSGHVVYGQALYDAGRIDEARGVFQQALALDPENLIVLRHLGDIARKKGEVEEARSWYSRALDGDPQDTEVAAYLAELTEPLATSDVTADAAAPVIETPGEEAEPESLKIESIEEVVVSESAWPSSESFDVGPVGDHATSLDDSPYLDDSLAMELQDSVPKSTEPVSAETTSAPSESEDELAAADMQEEGGHTSEWEMTPTPAAAEPQGAVEAPAAAPSAEPEATSAPTVEDRPARHTPTYESTPIVTRTLAELYLQQGYIEPALEIYRQLAERDPDDAGLQARISELLSVEAKGPAMPEESTVEEAEPDAASLRESEDEPVVPEEMITHAIPPDEVTPDDVTPEEVDELVGSGELWDTADSWGAGMFEDVQEEDEIFGLGSIDDFPVASSASEVEDEIEAEESEAPGAKTPAVEVPAEDEVAQPVTATEAAPTRGMTIGEFFATLGKARPPSDEIDRLDEETAADLADEEAGSTAEEPGAEEQSYPYADDAFANLFQGAEVNPEDSRAAAALSGAMAHPAPAAMITTPSQSRPATDASTTVGDLSVQESEEDVRRFREWLEGLANS
ncbi:MAG: tetratricopeptide repeat protein [Gemmatimonadaceae bacterium]